MTSMYPRLAILIGALLFSGASGTYKVQRAGLVPHQQPNQRSGRPIGDNRSEFSLGTSTLSLLTDPKKAPDANAGLYIPRVHVSGGVRFRMNRQLDLGLLFDYGLDNGSIPIQEGQPVINNGDVYGGGITTQYVLETGNPDLTVGFGLDVLIYSVPYVEYRSCVPSDLDPRCEVGDLFVQDSVEYKRNRVPVGALGITPAWRLNPNLSVFGGITMRNHPTVPRVAIENAINPDQDPVESGPANFITNAGIEYSFNNGVRAMVHVFQPIYADPVRYGPTFGAAITIPLSRDPKRDPGAPPPIPVASN